MVCVDSLREVRTWSKWVVNWSCHLFSDDNNLDELHEFAAKIGLKRSWFQDDGRLPHYDLTAGKRQFAVKEGAAFRSVKDVLKKSVR